MGRFEKHVNIDVDPFRLELAGSVAIAPNIASGSAEEEALLAHARALQTNAQRQIGCFVLDFHSLSATFYFAATHQETLQALVRDRASIVYVADYVTLRSMSDLYRRLECVLDSSTCGSQLRMQQTTLRMHPEYAVHHCSLVAWCKWCLERPGVSLEPFRHSKLNVVNADGAVIDRAYGAPHTGEWQRCMEESFPMGLADDQCILGLMVSMDGTNMVGDGSRQLMPVYAVPEAYSLEDR